jgi:hypothetical protein
LAVKDHKATRAWWGQLVPREYKDLMVFKEHKAILAIREITGSKVTLGFPARLVTPGQLDILEQPVEQVILDTVGILDQPGLRA